MNVSNAGLHHWASVSTTSQSACHSDEPASVVFLCPFGQKARGGLTAPSPVSDTPSEWSILACKPDCSSSPGRR